MLSGRCQRIIENRAGWTGYAYVTHPRYGTILYILDRVGTAAYSRNRNVEEPWTEGKPPLLSVSEGVSGNSPCSGPVTSWDTLSSLGQRPCHPGGHDQPPTA